MSSDASITRYIAAKHTLRGTHRCEGVRDHREFADAARRLDVAQGEGREYAGDDHSSLHSHLFFVTELAHGFFGQGS